MGQRHVCETGAKKDLSTAMSASKHKTTPTTQRTLSLQRQFRVSMSLSSEPGNFRTYTTSSFTSMTSLFLVAHLALNRPAHQSIPWVDHKAPSPTIFPSQRPSTISVGRLGAGPHGVRLDHHVSRGLDRKAARKLGVLQYSADTGQVGNLLPARIRLRQSFTLRRDAKRQLGYVKSINTRNSC